MTRLPLLAFLLLHPAAVEFTTLNWKVAASGAATTAGNWTPSQVPASDADLIFNVGGAYTVTWDGIPQVLNETYKSGTVTSNNTGPLTISALFRVGQLAGDNATLLLTSGAITATDLTVGNGAGSTGVLTVSGPTAQVSTPNTSDIAVGSGGTGTLNLTNGGRVSVANFSVFGGQATGIGNMLVSGISASQVRSQFSGGAVAPGTLSVGVLGHSSVTVDAGGLLTAADHVTIGSGVGSVGSVLVKNASGATHSTLNVTGTLDVAVAPGASAAGTGSLDLTNLGDATISGLTTVGDPNGGTGKLHVRNACVFTSGGLLFDDAHGVLDWTGGTIVVDGGAFHPPGTTLDIAGNSRRLELKNGASSGFTGASVNAFSLIVGDNGPASLEVRDGAQLATSATLGAGISPGVTGTLELDGATWQPGATVSQAVFGLGGTGVLNVLGGGTARCDTLFAAYSPGSSSTLLVSGAGSSLTAKSLSLGGHGTTAGGTANVTVDAGASLASDGGGVGIRLLSPATLAVNNGATVTAPAEIDADGAVTLAGGTITTPKFVMGAGGTLVGHGTVLGLLLGTHGTETISAAGGLLDLGDPSLPAGVSYAGTLNVGSAAVRLRSQNIASVGSCSIGGGTLDFLHPAGGEVSIGKALTGFGTVLGKLTSIGTITASAPSLAFADTLVNSGLTMNGTKFTFLPTSTYLGQRAINVDCDALDAQAGSRLEFLANSTIGKNVATTTVTLAGRMFLHRGVSVTVNHLASADCPLGTFTQVDSAATLNRAQGFSLQAGDTLEGIGAVSGGLVNAGVVAPGIESDPKHRLRPLTILGPYTQAAGGKLVVELGKASTNEFDVLSSNGAVTLAGALEVRFAPGFDPSPGETFNIVQTFGTLSGTFSTVTFGGFPVGNAFTVSYDPHFVRITIGSLVDVPTGLPRALAFTARSGALDQAALLLALPADAHVRVELYSVTGRRIAVVCERDLKAGTERFRLADLAAPPRPGVWFARAKITTKTGTELRSARVVLR